MSNNHGGKIGEEIRGENRYKHIQAVSKKSTALFDSIFTQVMPPSEDEFLTMWDKFSQGLSDTFGKQKDYRLAFNRGLNTIKHYQEQHGWIYSAPSYLITNKPPIQFRSPKWLKGAWSLYDSFHEWKQANLKNTSQEPQYRYQCLLLSLLMDSGHCNIDVIKSFNRLLSSREDLSLQGFSDYTFVTLEIESDHLNTNDTLNGKRLTTYQCYLSSKTLGQLKLWQKIDKKNWLYPNDASSLLAIINNNFQFNKHFPSSLKQLCSCAAFWYELHSKPNISEALIEYRVGRTHSYSLPTSNLKRLIVPIIYPVESSSFYSFSNDVHIKHTRPPSTRVGQKSILQNQYITQLKIACAPTERGNKVSQEKTRSKLEALLGKYQFSDWQQVFIEWLIHKTYGCSAKTVHQYMLNQVKYWILMNSESSLSNITTTIDLEEAYQEQANRHMTSKSEKYYMGRLKELHAFALPLLNLPVISDEFFYTNSCKSHTRAGIVDEALFKALLVHITTLTDINASDKLLVQTVCIISYRCGLRMAELYKLKIDNIENSVTGWIDIRSNNLGNNKTASSLRKIPLFPLLTDEENNLVSQYLVNKKRDNVAKTAPLLTMGIDLHTPFDMFNVSNYVGKVLRALSGEQHYVFYHLRHSCLSRLQLMLEHDAPKSLLPGFFPYSDEQNKKIKNILFKSTYSYGYWEIAAFSGHESPSMTFKHYLHLSDLLSAPNSTEKKTVISLSEAQVSGLCSRREFQRILKENKEVLIEDCITPLNNSLHRVDLSKSVLSIDPEITRLDIPTKEDISITNCYQVLEAISSGEDINKLTYRFHISQETIEKWLSNSLITKSITIDSNRDNVNKALNNTGEIYAISRLFSKNRTHALVLGNLKTQEEKKYADKFITALRENYKSNKVNIIEMMNYSLTHCSSNKSGIRFNSPSTLKKFLDTFSFAIPKSHWRAVKFNIRNSNIKEEWSAILTGISTIEEKQGTRTGRGGNGAIRLELISPSEKLYTKGRKLKKYSSHLFIYIMFMTFILIHNTGDKKD